ncbi:MAG: histidine kinase [bacterium]
MRKNILTICLLVLLITGLLLAMIFNHNIYTQSEMEVFDSVYIHENGNENKVSLDYLKNVSTETVTFSLYFESINSGDKLYFYSDNSLVEFYSADSKVTVNYDSSQDLYQISLNDAQSIEITYHDNVSGIFIDKIYVCDSSQFSSYLFVKDVVYIVLILLTLFCSIIISSSILVYSLMKRNLTLFFGYIVLIIVLCCWCITQVDYFKFIFRGYIAFDTVSLYLVFLLPVSVLISSESLSSKTKYKHQYQIILAIITFISTVFLVLHSTKVFQIKNAIELWFAFSLLMLGGIIFLSKEEIIKDDINENELLFKSTIVIVIGMLLDLLGLRFNLPGANGIFITVALLIVFGISLNSIIGSYVKTENYRRYLSEENERLTSSILLSQIKPHFLYNALNSISYLCKRNPQKADIAVVKFSRYLRQNMKSIEDTDMIEFANELEHIKNYLYLEQIRFPNIEFKFEIEYTNFDIPPLCIQPIVENSVKHGASKNPDGGVVCLKSYKTERFIVIEVSDNGIGFDDQKIIKGTGLSNISRRFAMHLDADVEFQSKIGKGTVVRVKIPRKDKK